MDISVTTEKVTSKSWTLWPFKVPFIAKKVSVSNFYFSEFPIGQNVDGRNRIPSLTLKLSHSARKQCNKYVISVEMENVICIIQ